MLGDSVVDQEATNFRCLFADELVQSSNGIFSFRNGLTIQYLSLGRPWHPSIKNQTEVIGALNQSHYVYFNIGNHYNTSTILRSHLEEFWSILKLITVRHRPRVIARLQAPVHFHSETGHKMDFSSTAPADSCIQGGERFFYSNRLSHRYDTFKEFLLNKSVPFINLHDFNMGNIQHPSFHDGIRFIGDCLHYSQDTWDLSVINAAMVSLIDRKGLYFISHSPHCTFDQI